jgi:hypothetical protein
MKTEKTDKLVLAVGDRRRVAMAFCSALDAQSNTGSIVTQVCDVARSIMRGKPFPDADMAAIVADITAKRGWEGPTAKVRASEVRTVLSTYAKLPEAIKIAQQDGPCNWHFAMKLARIIKKGKTGAAAVKEARKVSEPKVVPVEARIASLLRKLYRKNRAKRDAAAKAWDALGLKGEIA